VLKRPAGKAQKRKKFCILGWTTGRMMEPISMVEFKDETITRKD
jgi:hypothetical protein